MERRAYEVFTAQAVCSTIAELQLQKIKEENHAGGSYTENDCPCFQVLKADCRCTEKSHEDVSGAPEIRETGNAWENVSEKAGRSVRVWELRVLRLRITTSSPLSGWQGNTMLTLL